MRSRSSDSGPKKPPWPVGRGPRHRPAHTVAFSGTGWQWPPGTRNRFRALLLGPEPRLEYRHVGGREEAASHRRADARKRRPGRPRTNRRGARRLAAAAAARPRPPPPRADGRNRCASASGWRCCAGRLAWLPATLDESGAVGRRRRQHDEARAGLQSLWGLWGGHRFLWILGTLRYRMSTYDIVG